MSSLKLLQDGSVRTLQGLIQTDPKQVFNAFLAGIGIVRKDSQLRAMIVDYDMPEQQKVEQRLPGGCMKPEDVVLAIQQMNGEYSALRKKVEIEAGFLEMDKIFIEGLDHRHSATVWSKFTEIILSEINSTSEEFEILVRASYDNCLRRELSSEVCGDYKDAYICAIHTSGPHKKIACLLTGYKGPETVESSSEEDIKSASMRNVGTIDRIIAGKHRNFFQAACGLYAQMHPAHAEELSVLNK